MAEGQCPKCNETFRNVGAHLRHCKGKKQTVKIEHPSITKAKKPSLFKRLFSRNKKEKVIKPKVEQFPTKLTLPETWNTPQQGTEEEHIKDFFLTLPKWVAQPPTGLKRMWFNMLNRGLTILPCVWVAENDEPVIAYVPYNPKQGVIFNPKTGGVYSVPIRGRVAFFNRDKFLPLINTPPVHEKYDIPQHLALYLYNLGLGEGQLLGFDDLINLVKGWGFYIKVMAVLLIGSLIVNVVVGSYFSGNHDSMASVLNNMTVAIGK